MTGETLEKSAAPPAAAAPSAAPETPVRTVFLSAGELSGDLHAARLLRGIPPDLRARIRFVGIGGDALQAEGMTLIAHCKQMAVVGFSEVIRRLPVIWRVWRLARKTLHTSRPDAILLVDYPGFNLRLAAYAKKLGIPVLYYISPQVWAWNRSRIPRMARIIDLLMVIFPFEVDVFRNTSMRTVFVGHPLVASVRATLAAPPGPVAWPDDAPPSDRVAILPGSRHMEIERLLPVLLDSADELHRRRPSLRFVIAAAGPDQRRMIAEQLAARPPEFRALCSIELANMRDVVRTARAAMVCSGTATVETGLLGCPMIIAYRAAPLTYWIGRHLVRVKWLGMVNLVADRTLCPEFIQHDATPSAIADAILPLLDDTPSRRAQLDGLAAVSRALAGDPSDSPSLLLPRFLRLP